MKLFVILLWLIVGCAMVIVAYFIPGKNLEIWFNVNAAGIAVLIYLIALVAYTMRKPFSLRTRLITWGIFFVVCLSTFVAWTTMDTQSHSQKAELMRTRGFITNDLFYSEMHQTLLDVLKVYYTQPPSKRVSLKEIFQQIHPKDSVGSNIYHFPGLHDSTNIYIASLSDSVIVLVGEYINVHVKGKNSSYQNYDGHVGLIQQRASVTAKGITYGYDN